MARCWWLTPPACTLDRTAAGQAPADLSAWPGLRFGHGALLERAWELRAVLRPWDALYGTLTEALGAMLITFDRGLAQAGGIRCPVEAPA